VNFLPLITIASKLGKQTSATSINNKAETSTQEFQNIQTTIQQKLYPKIQSKIKVVRRKTKKTIKPNPKKSTKTQFSKTNSKQPSPKMSTPSQTTPAPTPKNISKKITSQKNKQQPTSTPSQPYQTIIEFTPTRKTPPPVKIAQTSPVPNKKPTPPQKKPATTALPNSKTTDKTIWQKVGITNWLQKIGFGITKKIDAKNQPHQAVQKQMLTNKTKPYKPIKSTTNPPQKKQILSNKNKLPTIAPPPQKMQIKTTKNNSSKIIKSNISSPPKKKLPITKNKLPQNNTNIAKQLSNPQKQKNLAQPTQSSKLSPNNKSLPPPAPTIQNPKQSTPTITNPQQNASQPPNQPPNHPHTQISQQDKKFPMHTAHKTNQTITNQTKIISPQNKAETTNFKIPSKHPTKQNKPIQKTEPPQISNAPKSPQKTINNLSQNKTITSKPFNQNQAIPKKQQIKSDQITTKASKAKPQQNPPVKNSSPQPQSFDKMPLDKASQKNQMQAFAKFTASLPKQKLTSTQKNLNNKIHTPKKTSNYPILQKTDNNKHQTSPVQTTAKINQPNKKNKIEIPKKNSKTIQTSKQDKSIPPAPRPSQINTAQKNVQPLKNSKTAKQQNTLSKSQNKTTTSTINQTPIKLSILPKPKNVIPPANLKFTKSKTDTSSSALSKTEAKTKISQATPKSAIPNQPLSKTEAKTKISQASQSTQKPVIPNQSLSKTEAKTKISQATQATPKSTIPNQPLSKAEAKTKISQASQATPKSVIPNQPLSKTEAKTKISQATQSTPKPVIPNQSLSKTEAKTKISQSNQPTPKPAIPNQPLSKTEAKTKTPQATQSTQKPAIPNQPLSKTEAKTKISQATQSTPKSTIPNQPLSKTEAKTKISQSTPKSSKQTPTTTSPTIPKTQQATNKQITNIPNKQININKETQKNLQPTIKLQPQSPLSVPDDKVTPIGFNNTLHNINKDLLTTLQTKAQKNNKQISTKNKEQTSHINKKSPLSFSKKQPVKQLISETEKIINHITTQPTQSPQKIANLKMVDDNKYTNAKLTLKKNTNKIELSDIASDATKANPTPSHLPLVSTKQTINKKEQTKNSTSTNQTAPEQKQPETKLTNIESQPIINTTHTNQPTNQPEEIPIPSEIAQPTLETTTISMDLSPTTPEIPLNFNQNHTPAISLKTTTSQPSQKIEEPIQSLQNNPQPQNLAQEIISEDTAILTTAELETIPNKSKQTTKISITKQNKNKKSSYIIKNRIQQKTEQTIENKKYAVEGFRLRKWFVNTSDVAEKTTFMDATELTEQKIYLRDTFADYTTTKGVDPFVKRLQNILEGHNNNTNDKSQQNLSQKQNNTNLMNKRLANRNKIIRTDNDEFTIIREEQTTNINTLNKTNSYLPFANNQLMQQLYKGIKETLRTFANNSQLGKSSLVLDYESQGMGNVGVTINNNNGTLAIILNIPNQILANKITNNQNELEAELKQLGFHNISLDVSADNNKNKNAHKQQGNENIDNVKLAAEKFFTPPLES